MAASGDNHLGGQDFNLILLEHLLAAIAAKLSANSNASIAELTVTIRDDLDAMRALREEAERIKINLNDEADCSGAFAEDDSGTVRTAKRALLPWTPSVLGRMPCLPPGLTTRRSRCGYRSRFRLPTLSASIAQHSTAFRRLLSSARYNLCATC